LSTVDFSKDSKEYALNKLSPSKTTEQNGHFEVKYNDPSDENSKVSIVIEDNGEKLTIYNFDDIIPISHINYAGLPLGPSMLGTQIVDYNGKIAFIRTSINEHKTTEFIQLLEKNLGKPTEIINNERIESGIKQEIINKLLKVFPENAKKTKSDWGNDEISYPERLFWDKDNLIYELTIETSGDEITNKLEIISKKAFKDKIIFGFHNPDKDPFLSKYLE
jgi:hypothetical protein